jgi:DNA-binding PadR family transcriptional regulator
MTHTIIVDPNTKIIEITVQGNATLGEIKEIISEAVQVAQKERSNLILGDAREILRNSKGQPRAQHQAIFRNK